MIINRHALREGIRIGLHGIKTCFTGPKRYEGSAEDICKQIVEGCWDKELEIFITSHHSYPIFYARDFGMCVDSLLQLGHRKRVRKTLAWALEKYKRAGRITQQINRKGIPFNFPDCPSPDAFAFLLHSIVALNDKQLIKKYTRFLEEQIASFTKEVVDLKSGLVKRKLHLGGMRDYAIRDCSCYDNTMVAAIKKYSTKLKLKHSLMKFDYEQLLIKHFWTGTYFKDDMVNHELTGDANIVPFWFGVLSKAKERALFMSVVKELQKRRLDKPVVLRYEPHRNSSVKMHWLDRLSGGWERDTVWLHLGNMFLQVLNRFDKKRLKRYLTEHLTLIRREQNYPEFLDKNGKPHHALFFHADDSMLWACNFLALSQTITS